MRLIDADALLSEAMADGAYGYVDAKQIADAPTIDAVPVVRCKDCKFRDTIDCGMQFYGYDYDENLCKSDDWTDDDGFCYWGERKDDG